ncbi:MAG TPA: hypothetical protein VH305_06495 [Gaiella sp.]|jgi:hypothetical protein
MRRCLPILVLVPLVALAATVSASAGAPGTWTRLTDPTGRNTDEAGLVRTPDGVLHVFWRRHGGVGKESVVHTTVGPTGKVGGSATVLGGFGAVDNPDAIVTGDQRLRVFFAGLGSSPGEGGVVSATAPLSGAGWTREGIRVSSTTSSVGPVGAGVTGAGAPAFSYSYSFHLGFHVGLDPGASDEELQPDNQCCDYLPDVATDAAGGRTMLAWFSLAKGREGIWAQQVLPSVGAPVRAPGSVSGGNFVAGDQRTELVARRGGPGVYLAYCSGYPTCKQTMLWRVGSAKPIAAGGSPDVEDPNAAPGPDGRLWVMWHDGQHSRTIFVRRTNKAVTRFGPLLRVRPPGGATAIWKLNGEGSVGPLDLLAAVTTGSSLATWHTQVLPPLALAAARTKGTVAFRVTDAGDPVAGAKVHVGGKTLTTNAAGRASLPLAGAAKATATMGGYSPASIGIGG